MKSPKDPVDHARTTRPHAGETMKDTTNLPALILLGLALASFVSALAAHASSNHTVGIGLGVLSAVLLAAAGGWFWMSHKRVRNIEEQWHEEHPEAPRQEPTS